MLKARVAVRRVMHTVPMRNEEELTQGSRKVTEELYIRDTVE